MYTDNHEPKENKNSEGVLDTSPPNDSIEKNSSKDPVQLTAIPGSERPSRKNEYILLLLVTGIIVAIVIALSFLGMRLLSEINSQWDLSSKIGQNTEKNHSNKEEKDIDDKGNGSSLISEYIGDNLSYIIEDESWALNEDNKEGKLNFSIQYPVIKELKDTVVQSKINKEIEMIAYQTRDMMYPEPTDNIKEVIGSDYFLFESQVNYQISYMDDNIISIVFDDHYFLGSVYAEYHDMRTVVFDLKTGDTYQLMDFLTISEDFIKEFRLRMISEDTSSNVFHDEEVLSDNNLIKILNGEILDGRYASNFFLSAKGIDIGMTYHYRSADANIIERGYITTLFQYDEIFPYAIPHPVWDALKTL